MAEKKRAVFLDRDGIINVDRGYVINPEEFEIIDGVSEAIRLLNKSGFLVIVVTNQSGIARGYYTEDQLLKLHQYMKELLEAQDAYLDDILYCPHLKGAAVPMYDRECNCRKPEPGLLLEAADRHGIELSGSYMIGDHFRDLEAGRRAGVKPILVCADESAGENGHGKDKGFVSESDTAGREHAGAKRQDEAEKQSVRPLFIGRNLLECVKWILSQDRIEKIGG